MVEYIQFFPTLRCNKSCEFCFSRGIFYYDFPEENIEDFIKILKKNKIGSLDILGGEPFLYRPLKRLIKKALQHDIEVSISTNGILIDQLRDFLKTFDVRDVKIGVSINESPKDDLLKIIKDYKLWIKSVVNKKNLPDRNLLEFAKNTGIKYYLIYMDAIDKEDLKISLSFQEFMNKIEEYKKIFYQIEPVFCKGFIGSNADYRCPAGSEKITIMPDGSVYPCYLLGRFKHYKLGNIFEDSFSEIVSLSKIEIFKNYHANICDNNFCNYYKKCKGGCIAHSIIHYGTHRESDPRCKNKDLKTEEAKYGSNVKS